MIDWLKKLFRRSPPQPHELAARGEGAWGRQDSKALGKAHIHARVYRAATGTWEDLGELSG